MVVAHSNSHGALLAHHAGGTLSALKNIPGDRTFRLIGLGLFLSTLVLAGLYASSLPAAFPITRLPLLTQRSGDDIGSVQIQISAGSGSGGSGGRAATASAPSVADAEMQQQVEHQPGTAVNPKLRQHQAAPNSPKQKRQQKQSQQRVKEASDKDELLPAAFWSEGTAYTTPESRCTIHADGELSEAPRQSFRGEKCVHSSAPGEASS